MCVASNVGGESSIKLNISIFPSHNIPPYFHNISHLHNNAQNFNQNRNTLHTNKSKCAKSVLEGSSHCDDEWLPSETHTSPTFLSTQGCPNSDCHLNSQVFPQSAISRVTLQPFTSYDMIFAVILSHIITLILCFVFIAMKFLKPHWKKVEEREEGRKDGSQILQRSLLMVLCSKKT